MSAVAKPVPNLSLMAKLAGQWDAKRKKVVAKRKELHKYMGVGGVRIPAVLTRIYDKAPNVDFSQGFECYLLNVQGAEKEDCTAFIPDCPQGHERIKISIRYNPKEPAPAIPASLPERPTETSLQSRTVRHFSTGDMECLNKLHPGQIVVLNGVNCRAYIPKTDNPTFWGVGFDVQAIEPVHGVTLSNLWDAARGAGTDYLMPTNTVFSEADNTSKYNRDAVALVSVFSEPTTEEGRAERAERMARENGLTSIEKSGWESKTWAIDEAQGRPRAMKASLDFLHFQWLTPELAETDSETVMIGMQLWKEQLTEFGIADIDTWIDLAPMIFSKLDFKTIGYVDNKGTSANFGGVAGDKDVDFALQFSCMAIIGDIATCYQRIGVPVTSDFINTMQHMPGCEPSGNAKAAPSNEDFLESLSDTVPMTGAAASASVSRKILDLARTDNSGIEFRALINYKMTPNNVKGIASLTAEEGSTLINALMTNSDDELTIKPGVHTDAEIASIEKVKGLFENISEGEPARSVAFAICRDAIPEDVKSRRNAQLIKFMTGKAPADARAIEAAPAAASASASASEPAPVATSSSVEELDDGDDDAEIKDADTATAEPTVSRKRDAPEPDEPKRPSKSKGKGKGKAPSKKKARPAERE